MCLNRRWEGCYLQRTILNISTEGGGGQKARKTPKDISYGHAVQAFTWLEFMHQLCEHNGKQQIQIPERLCFDCD